MGGLKREIDDVLNCIYEAFMLNILFPLIDFELKGHTS